MLLKKIKKEQKDIYTMPLKEDKKGPGLTNPFKILQTWADKIGLRDFSDINGPSTVEEIGLDNITGFALQVIRLIQYAMGVIAVIYTIYFASRLIVATDNGDDVYGSAKNYFAYMSIGLLAVFALDVFVTRVFVIGKVNFLENADTARQFAQIGSAELRGIYNLFQKFLAAAAVLMITFHGVRLVANAGDEGVVDNAKKNITWGVVGIILVGISEFVIKGILFAENGAKLDFENAKRLLVDLTNFVSGFIATVAIVTLIYGGYLYVFSTVGEDNTDKVKEMVKAAVIGILIAAAAFGLVNTAITLDSEENVRGQTELVEQI